MFGTRYCYAATRGIGGRRLRAALLASSALALAWTLPATPSRAQDATWLANPGSGDFFDANNWSPGSVPTGTASFGASNTTTLTLGAAGSFGGWTFNAGASNYTFAATYPAWLQFVGAGIVVNGGSAAITNGHVLIFYNASTAGSATITNTGNASFSDSSSAGSAAITNSYSLVFGNSSTAGSASITNNYGLSFRDTATAGSATITSSSSGIMTFGDTSTAGSAFIINNGSMSFNDASTTGNATILNNANGNLHFLNTSTAGGAAITNGGNLYFYGTSTAGSANITNNNYLQFYGTSTAGSATITNNWNLLFFGISTAGSATITNSGSLGFVLTSTAGNANITNNDLLRFFDTSTTGNATITNNSFLSFFDASTAGNATITNNNFLQFGDTSTAGSAALINNAGGAVDFSGSTGPNGDGKLSAGSIAGAGSYFLGANELTVGSNTLSTEVSGVIFGSGSLIKVGAGKLTLSGVNTYTGATTVDGGTLAVNGSILASSGVTVNSGGTLGGTGIVGNTLVDGGTLSPGNSIGLLTVQGSLAFTAAASYMVELSPDDADRVNVTGAATLGGATVKARFAPASYIDKKYTILNAGGGVNGIFGSLVVDNLPSNFGASLSYDAHNAYLDLALQFAIPGGLAGNPKNVGNALTNYFNTNGTIPVLYALLSAPALAQAAGETATGSQQTMVNAMTQFMGVMTDPYGAGRESGVSGALSVAESGEGRSSSARVRQAYATMANFAPRYRMFEQGWSVWAGGFGGSQTTDGNVVAGSHGQTSRVFGTVAGADYWFSPKTVAGFALAGGGTSFSAAGNGSGRSDLFQAGAFVRHTEGAAYFMAAAAYGWQDITTDRTVTIAGIDRLHATFQANSFAGRLEGGNRYVLNGFGLTPYAAGQVTAFQLPAYAESVLSGTSNFALSYGAKTVTASRSEIGLRTDKSWAVNDAILTLRGRAAWAHDFNPDRAAAATFQTLPGASFVVNGAAQAKDAALATASAEMKWRNGLSVGATFEGEFSNVSRSYAGKGIVRHVW